MILQGDALTTLSTLADLSVDCVITSPPYWGLRDYGVSGQIGLESSPEEYVQNLVSVFREVRRVLKDDGTLWLNLGDSYSGSGRCAYKDGIVRLSEKSKMQKTSEGTYRGVFKELNYSLKPKDLVGIPWRVAFALQEDGWYLRQDIIWHKPNPMPESVRDRCTKAHEYIFLLSKSKSYFFDVDSIKEPSKASSIERSKRPWSGNKDRGMPKGKSPHSFNYYGHGAAETRNRRSVWSVTPKAFKGAHFATFPPDLIEPCILAGTKKAGIVLDPFFGAGTTGLVAQRHGRSYIGIELNPEYIKIAEERLKNEKEKADSKGKARRVT